MEIGKDIYYVGVNDQALDLFEGQYPLKQGVTYNSYVIKDEKIVIMDTVDKLSLIHIYLNLLIQLPSLQ